MLKYRRILAFMLDTLFIAFIVIVLCNNSTINKSLDMEEKYQEAYIEKINHLNISTSNDPNELINSYRDNIGIELHNMYKVQGYRYLVFIICSFLYFIVFVYFNDGKTLGCALFKLKITNKSGNKANLLNLSIRSLFMGSSLIYLIPITSIIFLIIPRVFDYSISFMPLILITSISTLVEIVFYIYFIFNKNNMSIHDYISGTKIIDTSK